MDVENPKIDSMSLAIPIKPMYQELNRAKFATYSINYSKFISEGGHDMAMLVQRIGLAMLEKGDRRVELFGCAFSIDKIGEGMCEITVVGNTGKDWGAMI